MPGECAFRKSIHILLQACKCLSPSRMSCIPAHASKSQLHTQYTYSSGSALSSPSISRDVLKGHPDPDAATRSSPATGKGCVGTPEWERPVGRPSAHKGSRESVHLRGDGGMGRSRDIHRSRTSRKLDCIRRPVGQWTAHDGDAQDRASHAFMEMEDDIVSLAGRGRGGRETKPSRTLSPRLNLVQDVPKRAERRSSRHDREPFRTRDSASSGMHEVSRKGRVCRGDIARPIYVFMCRYVCMSVCMCVCLYACMYVCM